MVESINAEDKGILSFELSRTVCNSAIRTVRVKSDKQYVSNLKTGVSR